MMLMLVHVIGGQNAVQFLLPFQDAISALTLAYWSYCHSQQKILTPVTALFVPGVFSSSDLYIY